MSAGRLPFLSVLGLLALGSQAQEDPAAIVRGEAGAELDECAAGLKIDGTVLVARDGVILLARGYGLADSQRRVPCRVRTLYDIAWLRMELTAALVLRLAEAGWIALEDPIGDYLTGVPPDKEPITILQLLSHTSGLPLHPPSTSPSEAAAVTLEGACRRIHGLTLEAPPGTRRQASTAGYVLLLGLVQSVTGSDPEEALRALVLEPLGMLDTGPAGGADLDLQRAARPTEVEHNYRSSPVEDRKSWLYRGYSGMVSTVLDLLRLRRVWTTDVLLSETARTRWLTPLAEEAGIGHYVYRGETCEAVGSAMGYYGLLRYSRQQDLLVVVLGRGSVGATDRLRPLHRLAEQQSVSGEVRAARAATKQLTGDYRHPDGGLLRVTLEGACPCLLAADQAGHTLLLTGDQDRGVTRKHGAQNRRMEQLLARLREGRLRTLGGFFDSDSACADAVRHWQAGLEGLGDVEEILSVVSHRGEESSTTCAVTRHLDGNATWVARWQGKRRARSFCRGHELAPPSLTLRRQEAGWWIGRTLESEASLRVAFHQEADLVVGLWWRGGEEHAEPVWCPRLAADGSELAAAPVASPSHGATATLELQVPEYRPLDCTVCEGYRHHTCWCCGGSGRMGSGEDEQDCRYCQSGKRPCRLCGGSGDLPDPALVLPCPGCQRAVPHALAPGLWACPSCNGHGTYSIVGGARSATCAVCKGEGTFECTICGGHGGVPRLFPPARNPEAVTWQHRCAEACRRLESLSLEREASPAGIQRAARQVPGLAAIGKRLAAHLERAENLTKHVLQGSEEVAAFFRGATGTALHELIAAEQQQLETEASYLDSSGR